MAVNFDINSFIIDHPTRAMFMNSDDTTAWYTNQVQDLSIKVDGTEETKQDANGNTIATITRGKTCTVSFNTPVYDLNIIAALNGTKKEVAGADGVTSINTPCFEEIKVTDSNKTAIVLKNEVRAVAAHTLLMSPHLLRTVRLRRFSSRVLLLLLEHLHIPVVQKPLALQKVISLSVIPYLSFMSMMQRRL